MKTAKKMLLVATAGIALTAGAFGGLGRASALPAGSHTCTEPPQPQLVPAGAWVDFDQSGDEGNELVDSCDITP